MESLAFTSSALGSLGVELELQLIDPKTLDLKPSAALLLDYMKEKPFAGEVKPEITQSMIETSSSVHHDTDALREELKSQLGRLIRYADEIQLSVGMGGTHPFQRWTDRRIFPTDRFLGLYEQYGFLAKQFTVFGQHVHVGVSSGDQAIALTHHLGAYVPHFIALAASSPYQQGEDTRYDCSRLSVVSGFPLSGRLPDRVRSWTEFEAFFTRLVSLGVAHSLKDLYWDIRPKPAYGTVEVRVFDTPLGPVHAAALAALVQALAYDVLASNSPYQAPPYFAETYEHNRFAATRYGLNAAYVDPQTGESRPLAVAIENLLDRLAAGMNTLGSSWAESHLRRTLMQGNDSTRLRALLAELGTHHGVVIACQSHLRAEAEI